MASEQEGVTSILQQATEALQQLPQDQEEEEPAVPKLAHSAPVSGPPTPPVGLALSQPPGPTEQDLEERDMDCDVDPHPRGRAVPGADACEARLVAPTPPLAGFDTPSETRTPSLHGTPRQHYYGSVPNHESHSDGLMCMDQWGWKTDAPEFIPGRMKGLVDAAAGAAAGYPCAWAISPTGASGRGGGGSDGVGPDGDRLSQVWVQYEWQLKSKADKLREMQSNMNRVEFEVAEIRASREIERRSLVRQIGQYRAVLERYCIPLEEASGASFSAADDGRTGNPADFELSSHASGSRAVGRPGAASVPCNGSDPACGSDHGPGFVEPHNHSGSPPSLAAYGGGQAPAGADGCLGGTVASEPAPPASSLDSKMRQLNSLLQERNAHGQRQRSSTSDSNVLDGGEAQDPNAGGVKSAGGDYSSGSIASTLRAMFPHATIRTSRADSTGEERDAHGTEATGSDGSEGFTVEQQLRRLERSTGCQVDDRAMRSLRALSAKDARDALGKAEKLVDSQGGTCRNLSSILQSVCRKIEKRVGRAARQHQDEPQRTARSGGATATPVVQEAAAGTATRSGAGAATGGGSAECPRSQRRVRHLDEDGDAFDDSSESTGDGGPKNPAEQTDPPHGASPHACEDVRVQTVEEGT